MKRWAVIAATALLAACAFAHAAQASGWAPLVDRLAQDGYSRYRLARVFTQPGVTYRPEAMGRKIRVLFLRKFGTGRKQAAKQTAAKKSAPAIYKTAMDPKRIAEAQAFHRKYRNMLKRVRKTYGVPIEIAVAILSVESRVGKFLGSEPALVTLASMARADSLAQIEHHFDDRRLTRSQRAWLADRIRTKADWAYAELKALLDHAADNGHDPLAVPGSIYGAIGMCQFMPSNALRFGVDGDGDGRVDLFTAPDAIFSLANFLKANGWNHKLSVNRQRKVLYRYNHSNVYANTILAVADKLRH